MGGEGTPPLADISRVMQGNPDLEGVPVRNSAFTLATSELYQTGVISFSKADISRTTGTCQVSVVLLISALENEIKPVWHSSEVASVNAL